jgi:DNA replication and repair protein RecF
MLESLAVLSGWGAFAGNRTSSLVCWDPDEAGGGALLAARAEGERAFEVKASITTRLSFRVDGERASYSGLRSLLPSLIFLPRDIDLLDGPPSLRRLFIDRLCALISPPYARRLAEYRQILRQRTVLLRSPRPNRTAFEATTLPLIRFGGWIRAVRRGVVDLLEGELAEEHALLPCVVVIALEHRGSGAEIPVPGRAVSDKTPGGIDSSPFEESLAADLRANLERERHAGTPLVGPHRDDLSFSCSGRSAALSLSRGQKRRTVAAMILAAGRVIRSQTRISPILLLDDVAAELDAVGRNLMGRALAASGWQVFLTGAENPFPDEESTIVPLQDGVIL